MQVIAQDLRYAARMLWKKRAFTSVGVVTLALAIGASTAIFSVVNSILLKPLPYPQSQRLMMVWESSPKDQQLQVRVAVRDFIDWRQQNTVFEEVAAMAPVSFNLAEGGDPEYIEGQVVSASLLPLLGVKPIVGRAFDEAEDKSGNGHVVMLSYDFWQRRFGGDANLIGRGLALSGDSYTVVGILPREFRFPERADFLIPLGYYGGDSLLYRGMHQLAVMGRLKPGVTFAQAQAEMNATAQRVWEDSPLFVDWNVTVVPLTKHLYGDARQTLLILWVAVTFVLLISCANLANLLLARRAVRQKEMAIRAALGAGRLRLVRQLLTESLLLALLGGVAGVLLAYLCGGVIRQLIPLSLPQLNDVKIDLVVLGYALLITIVTGVLFGVGPALGGARTELNQVLKESGKSSMAGRTQLRWLQGLIVGEVALSLLLLAGAALLVKSFSKLQQVDAGMRVENTLTFRLTLPLTKYSQPHQRAGFFRQLDEKVKILPGVQEAGLGSSIPFSEFGVNAYTSVFIEGRPSNDFRQVPNAGLRIVNEGYFSALGTPIVRGRSFGAADNADAPWVAIINEAMARRHWPNSDPIGVRIRDGSSPDSQHWATIIGVVADVKNRGLRESTAQEIYIPYQQRPARSMTMLVHTRSDPATMIPAIRAQVAALDPTQPIYAVTTMKQLVNQSLSMSQLAMSLLGGLAILALLLAAIGLYGVLAYAVSQRLQEIGIRMALGAQRRDIFKLVIGQGLTLTLTGVGAGLLASFLLTRFLVSLLFGVSAVDPVSFGVITVMLVSVALLACYLPARRATKVDPMTALRRD